MNILVRKYKLFRYNWRGKESKLAQLSSLFFTGCLLLNSIIRLIFREKADFLLYAPIFIVSLQILIFLRYKKFIDRENEDLKLSIDSHQKYASEIMAGYLNVEDVSHGDYLEFKMYLAYPLKEWTPIWETLAKKDC